MPRRTKKQKIRTLGRKIMPETSLQDGLATNEADPYTQFRKDLTKSLIIILAIIALEIALYYGTMNNQLSLIMKLE